MSETTVTRGGQITLTKDIRERLNIHVGDRICLNILGDSALISKKDPHILAKKKFLPKNFGEIQKSIRHFSIQERLKRLKIIP